MFLLALVVLLPFDKEGPIRLRKRLREQASFLSLSGDRARKVWSWTCFLYIVQRVNEVLEINVHLFLEVLILKHRQVVSVYYVLFKVLEAEFVVVVCLELLGFLRLLYHRKLSKLGLSDLVFHLLLVHIVGL